MRVWQWRHIVARVVLRLFNSTILRHFIHPIHFSIQCVLEMNKPFTIFTALQPFARITAIQYKFKSFPAKFQKHVKCTNTQKCITRIQLTLSTSVFLVKIAFISVRLMKPLQSSDPRAKAR